MSHESESTSSLVESQNSNEIKKTKAKKFNVEQHKRTHTFVLC